MVKKNARMEVNQFLTDGIQNTTLRSVADRGNLEMWKSRNSGRKAFDPGVGWRGAPAAVSDMNDVELNIHTCEKKPKEAPTVKGYPEIITVWLHNINKVLIFINLK